MEWGVYYREEWGETHYVCGPFDEAEAKFWAVILPEGHAFPWRD